METSVMMMERPQREMMEKSRFRETFFSLKNVAPPRPDSIHTEFMETDWEEDDILSELEEMEEASARLSLDSSGRPSMTTLSTYDEVRTPEQRSLARFEMGPDPIKPVLGPRGPHLFRSSVSTVNSLEYQNALSMSPITPKTAQRDRDNNGGDDFQLPITLVDTATPRAAYYHRDGPFQFTSAELDDTGNLARWPPEKVAQWMLNAGVELQFAEKFVENDINGAILITLKFADLKELGIGSFGVRTTVWEEVHKMKNIRPAKSESASLPDPETPIEDEPSTEVRREQKKRHDDEENSNGVKRSQSSRRRKQQQQHHHSEEDTIRPGESVSIVGIEQVLPKPHHCSKGENCRKWRKQQRMMEAFKNDHPFVNLDSPGGVVLIAGDPGNPETARRIINKPDDDVVFRPISDAVPSVVASSDILGTEGLAPLQYLQQAQAQAQQELKDNNVRRFLELQHQNNNAGGGDNVPPTPPFEMLQPPPRKAPHGGLKALSKLSIPTQQQQHVSSSSNGRPIEEVLPESAFPGSACPGSAYPSSAHPQLPSSQPSSFASQQQQQQPSPVVYRFGTPFSDMDVPCTSVPIAAPVSRDISQSVPPEMNYHTASNPPPPSRSLSRSTFRSRPSFVTPAMPPVDENKASSQPVAPTSPMNRRPPPRQQWPWSPPSSARQFETAIAPLPMSPPASSSPSPYQYQGYMRKRKTRLLRHEWHEQYVTLAGTRLAVHRDHNITEHQPDPLEYVDVDDYAIACSGSLAASTSKLNAAFRAAMSMRRSDKGISKEDIAAFSFQLIPQSGDLRSRRRESLLARSGVSSGPVNGTGKTHHFAVRSRDERIDWMRELMLAKAMKQKGEGFEVSVNGNMI